MNVLLAMNVPTTSDDHGYFLWLAQNWTIFILPTFILATLLVGWAVGKIRAWTTGTPGSSEPPAAQFQSMELPEQPSPPSGPQQIEFDWPFELKYS